MGVPAVGYSETVKSAQFEDVLQTWRFWRLDLWTQDMTRNASANSGL